MKRAASYDKSVMRYCIGAIACALLTTVVYVVVVNGVFSMPLVVATIILAVALIQLLVQLLFFLDISESTRPNWRAYSFWFVALTVLIIVVGSIWVMKNLDYNMGMSPEQMQQRMLEENKKGF